MATSASGNNVLVEMTTESSVEDGRVANITDAGRKRPMINMTGMTVARVTPIPVRTMTSATVGDAGPVTTFRLVVLQMR